MKIIILFLFVLLPFSSFAAIAPDQEVSSAHTVVSQESLPDDFIKTTGVIQSIERTGSRKSKKHIATIEYSVSGSTDTLVSTAQILSIPLYGPLNKEGDTIDILYSASNPALIRTPFGDIVEKYGMHVLIALGVIFSFGAIFSAIRKK